ncbi:MAG: hypothetical protein JW808_03860 [Victivallales bacterium]|nr:hypothetical protein [Victivallales bacterium]
MNTANMLKRTARTALCAMPLFLSSAFHSKNSAWLVAFLALCILVLMASLGCLALSLIISVTSPGLIRKSSAYARGYTFRNLLAGCIVWISYALYIVTVKRFLPSPKWESMLFTLPVSAVVFFGAFLGFSMLANDLGDKVHANINTPYLGSTFMSVLAGGALLIMVGFIPFAGPLCIAFFGILGTGLALRTFIGKRLAEGANKNTDAGAA